MIKSYLKFLSTGSFVVFTILLDAAQAVNWSCDQNATNVPVNIDQVSGLWYEVSRFPQSVVPACLKVNAPSAIENDEYILQLNYVNNVNNGWKSTTENITFPWNNDTQAGLFELLYKGDNVTVDVNFKYMGTFDNYTLVCGYSGVASGVSILRLLSRNKSVDSDLVQTIEKFLVPLGVDASQLTWVQQDGRCNGAAYLSSCLGSCLMVFLVLIKLRNFNSFV